MTTDDIRDWKTWQAEVLAKTETQPAPANVILPMYAAYGRDNQHTCGQCKHLIKNRYHDKAYFKCELARQGNSEATDFRKKWTACGKFEASK